MLEAMGPRSGLLAVICATAAGLGAATALGQPTQPVATALVTIDRYPTFFHGRTVSLIGTPTEVSGIWRLPISASRTFVVLPRDGRLPDRSVELRGVLFDVGQMPSDDSRLSAAGVRAVVDAISPDRWPARNTLYALTSATWFEAPKETPTSVRGVVLRPDAFDGKTVTLRGRFRAQNLYGDIPFWPRQSQWDFVLQAADATIWVTGRRPRGRGIDLDPTTRRGAGTWLEATGVVRYENGLARLEAIELVAGKPIEDAEPAAVPAPPPLPPPAVIFSTPLDGESDVDPSAVIRVQFSRDMQEASFENAVKVTYGGDSPPPVPAFAVIYQAPTRSIEVRFKTPLAAGASVTVSLGSPIAARDGVLLPASAIKFRTK
jgi:Bacterial Ig-like domain